MKLKDIYSWNLYQTEGDVDRDGVAVLKLYYQCDVIHKQSGQRVFKTTLFTSEEDALDSAFDYMYENLLEDSRSESL